LLSNVLYLGQVNYQGKVYPGEQPAVVDRKQWKKEWLTVDGKE
jgi:hypothetical protein